MPSHCCLDLSGLVFRVWRFLAVFFPPTFFEEVGFRAYRDDGTRRRRRFDKGKGDAGKGSPEQIWMLKQLKRAAGPSD